MKINDLFVKKIGRNIQGVVKIGQDDPEVIINELEEYVVTRELAGHFLRFFENYRKGSASRTDKMGVWISGFFGSGKSHFLKILSYLLSGKEYGGKRAYYYFDGKVADPTILADMKAAGDVSTDVILFNIDAKSDADSKANKDAIVKVFMKVFNEMQGFCGSMPWIADLERQMTREGTYGAFKDKFRELSGTAWEQGREDFYFISDTIIEALAATQKMSAETARHWCESSESGYSIDIDQFARKVREYIELKSNELGRKHFVVFLCDELGQYMGTDGNLLLNLQTVVESLGTECGGRAWVVATGQEDISSIVKETKGGRDAFSKIIGRFDTRLPLSSANADEVIKERLLKKKEEYIDSLRLLYAENSSVIKNLITFSNDTPEKKLYADETDFSDVYPFIPYQFKLLQDVFTGIRQHGASGKHLSEGERSLLNAFQEAAKVYADSMTGTIIPFDAFYRTIETFLDHNIRKVIINAEDNVRLEMHDIPILKSLFMVKYIADKCPANLENLTTLLLCGLHQDRLALRKQIDESLRRLESERLIIRNGEQFIFLTDEEQDVNREIREISIDRSDIVEKVGDETINIIFGLNRKYRYNERHDFSFNVFIDDRARGQQKDEIGIRILTPYYTGVDVNHTALAAMSIREKNVIVALPATLNFMDEMELALQIDVYLHKKVKQAKTETIEEIIAAKNREWQQRKQRCHEYLEDALKLADIYANSAKLDIKAKEPSARINEAFHTLIESIYTKLHFIDSPFITVEELRTLLRRTDNQIKLDGLNFEKNKLAIEDVTEYVTRASYSNVPITVRSLIDNFGKSPYGWKENDTVGVLLTLFKRQEIRLEMGAQALTITEDQRVVDACIKRDTNDRVVIKVRIKVTTDLLNNAKNLARDLFNYSAMPNDEDGIMAKFKELADNELYKHRDMQNNRNDSIVSLLAHYENHRYPGKEVLESGKKLFESVCLIKDVRAFFEALLEKKEELLNYEEDVTDVKKFFLNQREIFDKALKMLNIFEKNRTYVLEKKTTALVSEIERITRLKSPYSEIHLLPDLIDEFIKSFSEILEEECSPIQANIREDWTTVKQEFTRQDLENEFAERTQVVFSNMLDRLSHVNNLYEAVFLKTESDKQKMRLIDEIENAAAKRRAKNEPNTLPAPTRKVKTVSVKSLFSGTTQVTSENEIEAFVDAVRQKLLSQLEENTTIKIV
jgi:hypothetical protein